MGREESLEDEEMVLQSFQGRLASGILLPPRCLLAHSHPWKVFWEQPWCKGGVCGWMEKDVHFSPSSATS